MFESDFSLGFGLDSKLVAKMCPIFSKFQENLVIPIVLGITGSYSTISMEEKMEKLYCLVKMGKGHKIWK